MLTPVRKSFFLYVEALVCFGPLAFVLFFGVLIFPIWIMMLIGYSLGSVNLAPDQFLPMPMPWLVIWPMTLVACGVLGLVGLARVLWILSAGIETPRWPIPTVSIVALGMFGVIAFNVYEGRLNPFNEPVEFLSLFGLPVLGSLHFTYLARQSLFRRPTRDTFSASHNNALERTRNG